MQYFFDTSAIVKLYHPESASEIALSLYKENESIVVSEISKIEFISTIHKKYRNNEINLETLNALKERFFADALEKFKITTTASIVDSAIDFIEKNGRTNHLFSLDALQLAAFLLFSEGKRIFVCADKRLTSLVKSIGYEALELLGSIQMLFMPGFLGAFSVNFKIPN